MDSKTVSKTIRFEVLVFEFGVEASIHGFSSSGLPIIPRVSENLRIDTIVYRVIGILNEYISEEAEIKLRVEITVCKLYDEAEVEAKE
jgi:hypothetical protein